MQLTHPAGAEQQAREFYAGLLGLQELSKPAELEGRGGVWFDAGGVQLHFGVEERGPDSRRHVALEAEDLPAVAEALARAGYPIEAAVPLDGYDRFYTRDPFGTKLELMAPVLT